MKLKYKVQYINGSNKGFIKKGKKNRFMLYNIGLK